MGVTPAALGAANLANLDFDPAAPIGALYVKGAAGSWSFVPPGPLGSLLQSGGAGVVPSWILPVGAGDMLAATYDPNGRAADAFSFANMHAVGELNGDLLIRAGGTWAPYHAGANGRVLTSNGPGVPPTWQISAGNMRAAIYDPNGYAADAFDLANMHAVGETFGDILVYGGPSIGWTRAPLSASPGLTLVSRGAGVVPTWVRAPMGPREVDRMRLTRTSASTLSIGAGKCRDIGDEYNIELTASTAIDLLTNGAGGLDTGSLAPSTWLEIYAIDGPTAPAVRGLAVLYGATPVMPALYSRRRKVGIVRIGPGVTGVLDFVQDGNDRRRVYLYNTTITGRAPLVGGSATTPTLVDCSTLIPPSADLGIFTFRQASATRIATFYRSTTDPAIEVCNPSERTAGIYPVQSQAIAYSNDGPAGSVSVIVRGFVENL
jgi:hypothetical protein